MRTQILWVVHAMFSRSKYSTDRWFISNDDYIFGFYFLCLQRKLTTQCQNFDNVFRYSRNDLYIALTRTQCVNIDDTALDESRQFVSILFSMSYHICKNEASKPLNWERLLSSLPTVLSRCETLRQYFSHIKSCIQTAPVSGLYVTQSASASVMTPSVQSATEI